MSKYEDVYLNEYDSPKEAYHQLTADFNFCNFEHPHQAWDYQAPPRVCGAYTPRIPVIYSTLTNHPSLF